MGFDSNLDQRPTKADHAKNSSAYSGALHNGMDLSWITKHDGYVFHIALVDHATQFGRRHLLMPSRKLKDEGLTSKSLTAKVKSRAAHRDDPDQGLRGQRHQDKYGPATGKNSVLILKNTTASPNATRFIEEKAAALVFASQCQRPKETGKEINGQKNFDFGVECVYVFEHGDRKPTAQKTMHISYDCWRQGDGSYFIRLKHVSG